MQVSINQSLIYSSRIWAFDWYRNRTSCTLHGNRASCWGFVSDV